MHADLEILEFKKILNEYSRYATTDPGKRQIREIRPTNDKNAVKTMLDEVATARTMIERYDETPLTGVLDIKEAVTRARIGGTMSIEELLRIVSFVEAETRTDKYIRKIRQLEIPTASLDHYYDRLTMHPRLQTEIESAIDQKGRVYDNASPELAQVRKKMVVSEKRITEKMNSLLQSEAAKLTDSLITIRNNRLVLPVKSEFKNQFKGIVHDQSASRETTFIEPMACVELNNQMQSLLLEEQEAIERILYRLSELVRADHDTILQNIAIFTELDIIFAKAKHALQYQEEMPEITLSEIELINARHPFIPKEQVVANTIAFGKYRAIVITGPNTGGKTVALKTLGLLSIMVQSGMFIPIDKGSRTIVFDNILADIGDEQSIEQSLSTFSSHITKIIHILRLLTPDSLILLDELGSGTDPKEGASLAISILDYLREKHVHQMVTTHYPELKVYAYNLDDTVNASVEFDIESLRPTYRLKIGIPGTSNALDIANRLGLEPQIIEQARKVSLSFDTDTSNLIKKLEQQSESLEAKIEANERLNEELRLKMLELEEEATQSRIRQNRMLKELEAKKQQEIDAVRQQAEKLVTDLDDLKKKAGFKEHELAKLKYELRQLGDKDTEYQKTNLEHIHVGDTVNVIPYQRNGIVMRKLNNREYEVQMGALSSVFTEDQLEFAKKTVETRAAVSSKVQKEGIAEIELDLRGKRYEEAMDLLDKFVDDCLFHHLEFASVIHGYGTGALKRGVAEYVKMNKAIKKSRPGGMSEGGQGVTIIYFK